MVLSGLQVPVPPAEWVALVCSTVSCSHFLRVKTQTSFWLQTQGTRRADAQHLRKTTDLFCDARPLPLGFGRSEGGVGAHADGCE